MEIQEYASSIEYRQSIFERNFYYPVVKKIDQITNGKLTDLVKVLKSGHFPKTFRGDNIGDIGTEIDFISPDPDFSHLQKVEQRQIESCWIKQITQQKEPPGQLGNYKVSALPPVIAADNRQAFLDWPGRVTTDSAWDIIEAISGKHDLSDGISLIDKTPHLYRVKCAINLPPVYQDRLSKSLRKLGFGENPRLDISLRILNHLAADNNFSINDWSSSDDIFSWMVFEEGARGGIQMTLSLPGFPEQEDEVYLGARLVINVPPPNSQKKPSVVLFDGCYGKKHTKFPKDKIPAYTELFPDLNYQMRTPLPRSYSKDELALNSINTSNALQSIFNAARLVFGKSTID